MHIEINIRTTPIVEALKRPTEWKRRMAVHHARAGTIVGMKAAKMMRETINNGVHAPNSPMTKRMKGSSKPLVDRYQMARSITHKVLGSAEKQEILVGVMRTSARANVAIIVTKGATIRVTKRMSMLFKVLNAASLGKPWAKVTSDRGQQLLAQSKGVIPVLKEGSVLTIPPRDFVAQTAVKPALKAMIVHEYSEAVRKTMNELKGRGDS